MRLVKISNVKNIYEARTIAEQGADFIGLHLVTREHLNRIPVFQQINRMLKSEFPQTKSILVTKERSVERLIELLRNTGCQGIEIHYPPAPGLFAMLRSYFGKSLIIMGVTSPVISPKPNEFALANYIIVNKNYVGGTGERIPQATIQEMVNMYKNQNVMLAGGIDTDAVRQLRVISHITGYDVQTSVMSHNQDDFENIDREQLIALIQSVKGKKNFVTSEKPPVPCLVTINQNPQDLFNKCDVFKFIIDQANYDKTIKTIKEFARLNTHLTIEVEVNTKDVELTEDVKKSLKSLNSKIKSLTIL